MLFLLFIAVEIKVTLALWKTETLFSFLVSLWQNKLMWQESDAKTSTCRISGCRGALKISDIDGNQYCQSENEVGEFLGWSGIHSANPPGKGLCGISCFIVPFIRQISWELLMTAS